MSLDTFSFTPSKGVKCTTSPRVLTAQFGDGYSQRVPDGLNNLVREWDLSFNSRALQQSSQILAFFVNKQGSTAFLWTPPGDTQQYTVICDQWDETYESPISRTIVAKFKQVFDAY